jgi:hypothetical protein
MDACEYRVDAAYGLDVAQVTHDVSADDLVRLVDGFAPSVAVESAESKHRGTASLKLVGGGSALPDGSGTSGD